MDNELEGFMQTSTTPESGAQAAQQAAPAQKRARSRKSIDQQIAETEERLRKLRAQAKSAERKARTKRLIETGAVVEKALGIELAEQADRERLLAVLCKPRTGNDGGTWTWASELARELTGGGER